MTMNDLLTMFPLDLIEQYALKKGWTIHRIDRTYHPCIQDKPAKARGMDSII